MRITDLVARQHLRRGVILPSVRVNRSFGKLGERALENTASTIRAVATGGKLRFIEPHPEEGCLAQGAKFLSSHVIVLRAAEHSYFLLQAVGKLLSGSFCPVEIERNKNAISCPKLLPGQTPAQKPANNESAGKISRTCVRAQL